MNPDRLAELMAEPARVAELTPADAAAALAQLTALCAAVAARVTKIGALSADRAPARPGGGDRLLTAREASLRVGMSTRWLYVHADDLPFAVRTSHRAIRFSEQGIERWLLKRHNS